MYEGSSAYQFDTDSIGVRREHFELDDEAGNFDPQIGQAGRPIIVAGVDLRVFLTADGSISLSTEIRSMTNGSGWARPLCAKRMRNARSSSC